MASNRSWRRWAERWVSRKDAKAWLGQPQPKELNRSEQKTEAGKGGKGGKGLAKSRELSMVANRFLRGSNQGMATRVLWDLELLEKAGGAVGKCSRSIVF
jgi:hypothetical protein